MMPVPGQYMGEKTKSCAVYNGSDHHQKNTLNPSWPPVVIAMHDLCDDGEIYKPILIDFWDHDCQCMNDDFMGYCFLSIHDLFRAHNQKKAIPLKPGKEGHKWGGCVHVEDILLREEGFDSDSRSSANLLLLTSQTGETECIVEGKSDYKCSVTCDLSCTQKFLKR